jgi:hypothetical protein
LTGQPESFTFGVPEVVTLGKIKPMLTFRRQLFTAVIIVLMAGCKQKKVSLAGDDPVKIGDFIEFFAPLQLPFHTDDAALHKKPNDSLLISYKVFTQFIPDSLVVSVFGKSVKPRIYAMGKASEPKKEYYLFVKMISDEKKAVFVLCFDNKEKYLAGMPVLLPDKYANTTQVAGIDRRFSIFKTVQRKNADGSVSEGKDVYIFDEAAKNFMLILTDPLEEKIPELVNPIDSLPGKNKFSADYVLNKQNMVSIRDGRKPGRLMFFIHFEKNKGECIGELKGETVFTTANTAEYHATGNLCALRFRFTSTSVTISEINPCGTYRGLHCLFEGTYPRKKNPVKK